MASSAMKGRAWTQKEDEALCKAYRWVSEDSVRRNCQTNDGVWTHVSKKYLEFYEGTTPVNIRNHETASRHESGVNYYDEVRQAEELYMDSNSKPFQFHSCWEICKGWVLFEDPPQIASTLVFGTASYMDEDGSPTIQQIMVENSASGEGSISRAMGRNKARRLKEKSKANDDYTTQHEVAASLRLLEEQNALEVEERKYRNEEQAKQIQEEMDDKNMEMNTSNYTLMSMTYFDGKKKKNYEPTAVVYL
ncbi:hypothetical protein D8674_039976 [Pyrus ussuriensis x Pyrus communis]|uniref:Myb-like domain-containing protein n=1 Tax=Pyrus ussuriensis x Pyrus communis TaxID=2448454 RepID=A0A5N5I2X4_9ROSA|nr:hypothetical protein D8674_039976 [Pyrus ussuriensis x Pyrus communis]